MVEQSCCCGLELSCGGALHLGAVHGSAPARWSALAPWKPYGVVPGGERGAEELVDDRDVVSLSHSVLSLSPFIMLRVLCFRGPNPIEAPMAHSSGFEGIHGLCLRPQRCSCRSPI